MNLRKSRERAFNLVILLALLLFATFIIIPLLWMLSASLRTPMDAFKWPPRIIPKLSAWWKYAPPGSKVTGCLPALMRS